MKTGPSWIAYYLNSFLIGIICGYIDAPWWAFVSLFAGSILLHSITMIYGDK